MMRAELAEVVEEKEQILGWELHLDEGPVPEVGEDSTELEERVDLNDCLLFGFKLNLYDLNH